MNESSMDGYYKMLTMKFNQEEVKQELRRSSQTCKNLSNLIRTTDVCKVAATALASYMRLVIELQQFPMAKAASKGGTTRSKKTGRFVKSRYKRWKEKHYPESANKAAILTTALMGSFVTKKTGTNSYKVEINPKAVGHENKPTRQYAPQVEKKYSVWEWGVEQFLTQEWPKIVSDARAKAGRVARG